MGYTHVSENVGDQRRIVIEKKLTLEKSLIIDQDDGPVSSQKPMLPESKSTMQDGSNIQQASSKDEKPKEKKTKAKSATKPKPKSIDTHDHQIPKSTEDDEKLMESFAREERQCKFPDCHQSISVLGEKCRFCIQIFCLKHAMPEIHGCGEAAKRHARMEYERTMAGPVKMTKSNSASAGEKRERLQTKLDEKLKTMKGQRQQKKPK